MISIVVSLLGEVSIGLAAKKAEMPIHRAGCTGLPGCLRGDMELFFDEKVKPKAYCEHTFSEIQAFTRVLNHLRNSGSTSTSGDK